MSRAPIDSIAALAFEAAGSRRSRPTIEDEVVALFEQYRHRVLRYLYCLGLAVPDAEEISQEVFLLLFRHLKDNKDRSNLAGWIFRVAHNLGLKRRSESQFEVEPQTRAMSLTEEHPDGQPSPEEQAVSRQRRERLLAVLAVLPQQQQHCLYLRAEGLQYREIAQILDISLGNVSQSIAKAIGRLNHAALR